MTFPLTESEKHSTGIYRIVCYATGDAYIGSTGDMWCRFLAHKAGARKGTAKVYRMMREVGIENFSFEIIAIDNDTDWETLLIVEAKLIRVFCPSMNTRNGYPQPAMLKTGLMHIDFPCCQVELPRTERDMLRSIAPDRKSLIAVAEGAKIGLAAAVNFRDKGQGSALNTYKLSTYLSVVS